MKKILGGFSYYLYALLLYEIPVSLTKPIGQKKLNIS